MNLIVQQIGNEWIVYAFHLNVNDAKRVPVGNLHINADGSKKYNSPLPNFNRFK